MGFFKFYKEEVEVLPNLVLFQIKDTIAMMTTA